MRVLLNGNCVDISAGLRQDGHDVESLPMETPDNEVQRFAEREKRTIITCDKDFRSRGKGLAASRKTGLVFIRVRRGQAIRTEDKLAAARTAIRMHKNELEKGEMVSVKQTERGGEWVAGADGGREPVRGPGIPQRPYHPKPDAAKQTESDRTEKKGRDEDWSL